MSENLRTYIIRAVGYSGCAQFSLVGIPPEEGVEDLEGLGLETYQKLFNEEPEEVAVADFPYDETVDGDELDDFHGEPLDDPEDDDGEFRHFL